MIILLPSGLCSEEDPTTREVLLRGFTHVTTASTGEICCRDTLPGSVRVVVIAPPVAQSDPRRPTRLILYALPNGNTIGQTMGRTVEEGIHWRYGIQHIAAQTRLIRSVATAWNIVVAYLEADGLSWPQWKRTHSPAPVLIQALVDTLRARVRGNPVSVTLTGHSGGGSLTFGLLDAGEEVPEWVDRISFLDSNYGFDRAGPHGTKLISWLRGSRDRVLSIIAYDDREIMLDGKKVLGPDGGTYRRSLEMLSVLRATVSLREYREGELAVWRDADRCIEVIIHTNPRNEILHTQLVERNGFVHAILFGTGYEGRGGTFWGAPAYLPWVDRGVILE